ncbi:hypothetical protein [Nonomuraea aurantiaca]|uniref:hypothetical protein n=1 Tax=Nonomuraea aurantiaca TaxID=2878562 RepID=UPI001CD9E998|nr:hypothetical protein [Nonomuraea aurantiaca]MCA2220936.1 hypothetical protein [Nonomuraea aurantiaca]
MAVASLPWVGASIPTLWYWALRGKPGPGVTYGIGAVAVVDRNVSAASRPFVFVRADDSHLWILWKTPAGNWEWVDQGGKVDRPVGVIALDDNPNGHRPYAFVVQDRHLWVRWWNGLDWFWSDQGQPAGVDIFNGLGAVTLALKPTLDLAPFAVVTGSDGNGWVNWWNGSSWLWYNLGSPGVAIGSSMGVLAVPDERTGEQTLQVYVWGGDGQLWLGITDMVSTRWTALGHPRYPAVISQPAGAAIIKSGPGQLSRPCSFVLSASTGDLWACQDDTWFELGAPPSDHYANIALGAISVPDPNNASQYARVFVTDGNNSVWVCRWDGAKPVWEDHGNSTGHIIDAGIGITNTHTSPAAAPMTHAFMRTSDGLVCENWEQ